VGVDSSQFQCEELKRAQFDLFQIKFSYCYLAVSLIAVKDWAKPPLDHADPYQPSSKALCLAAWKNICAPKAEGGLEIRNIQAVKIMG
jgi:hypothetical protein